MLHEIDTVGLQPPQRFVELARGFDLRATVDLGHQEDLIAIPVEERPAHPRFGPALVIVPAVVEERDAAVDRRPDDSDAERLALG